MGARLRLQARFRDLVVYPGSLQAQTIMHSAPLEEPRRKVYMAANSSTPEQIVLLENLLRARGKLATLAGKESVAHMTLTDKMAGSPGMLSSQFKFYIRVYPSTPIIQRTSFISSRPS